MGLASRQKGKRRERQFRDVLRASGYHKARRGQQFSGESGNPDVVCPEMPKILWEVKGGEACNIYSWLAQAKTDAGVDKLPIVVHKRSLRPWIAYIEVDVLLEILGRSDLVE